MKSSVILVLAVLHLTSCASTDEASDTQAAEPVVAEAAPNEEGAKPEESEAAPVEDENKDGLPTELPAETKAEVAPAQAEPAKVDAVAKAAESYVAVSHLNVRSGAGMQHPVVEVLSFNTVVAPMGVENVIWAKLGEGRYVSKNYLSEARLDAPMAVEAPAIESAAAPVVEETSPAAEASATAQPEADATLEAAPEVVSEGADAPVDGEAATEAVSGE